MPFTDAGVLLASGGHPQRGLVEDKGVPQADALWGPHQDAGQVAEGGDVEEVRSVPKVDCFWRAS